MAYRQTVSFDSSYLSGLDNVTANPTTLTDYQVCMLLQCALLLLQRNLWQDMTDSQWQSLKYEIAAVLEEIEV